MDSKELKEKIEQQVEILRSKEGLNSDYGLNALFTQNDPESIQNFIDQLDREKIIYYAAYYKQYNEQVEALELVERYEYNLKTGGLAMLLLAILSTATIYLIDDYILKLIKESALTRRILFSTLPVAFFNIFNSGFHTFRYYCQKEEKEEDSEPDSELEKDEQ